MTAPTDRRSIDRRSRVYRRSVQPEINQKFRKVSVMDSDCAGACAKSAPFLVSSRDQNVITECSIDVTQAAKILDTSSKTLKRMADRGEVPAFKVGNRWMFLASALDEWRNKRLVSNCRPCPMEKAG
jgi:excisionase family DNA binding protein